MSRRSSESWDPAADRTDGASLLKPPFVFMVQKKKKLSARPSVPNLYKPELSLWKLMSALVQVTLKALFEDTFTEETRWRR